MYSVLRRAIAAQKLCTYRWTEVFPTPNSDATALYSQQLANLKRAIHILQKKLWSLPEATCFNLNVNILKIKILEVDV